MVATIPGLSPNATQTAAGSFGISWDGVTQGTAYPDPETRFALRSGWLSNNETVPMWGGVGLYAYVPGMAGAPVIAQGAQVGRATSIAGTVPLVGFSVFDQAYGMVNSPPSPVPLIGSYGQVMYYLLGSGARIAVAADPSLISLESGNINSGNLVSWDFSLQRLIPYVAAYNADAVTNATWNSGTGAVTITLTTGGEISVGDDFTLSGIVSTGAGANLPNGYNGTFKAIAGTAGTALVYQGSTGSANNPGTYSTGGTLVAGGGNLPCKIERVYATGCMTVNQPDANSNVSWNRNGSAAVILI